MHFVTSFYPGHSVTNSYALKTVCFYAAVQVKFRKVLNTCVFSLGLSQHIIGEWC